VSSLSSCFHRKTDQRSHPDVAAGSPHSDSRTPHSATVQHTPPSIISPANDSQHCGHWGRRASSVAVPHPSPGRQTRPKLPNHKTGPRYLPQVAASTDLNDVDHSSRPNPRLFVTSHGASLHDSKDSTVQCSQQGPFTKPVQAKLHTLSKIRCSLEVNLTCLFTSTLSSYHAI
jgi:hypothetical protein